LTDECIGVLREVDVSRRVCEFEASGEWILIVSMTMERSAKLYRGARIYATDMVRRCATATPTPGKDDVL